MSSLDLSGLKLRTPEKSDHASLASPDQKSTFAPGSLSTSSDTSDIEFLCAPLPTKLNDHNHVSLRASAGSSGSSASESGSPVESSSAKTASNPFEVTQNLMAKLSLSATSIAPVSTSTPIPALFASTSSAGSEPVTSTAPIKKASGPNRPKPNSCVFVGSLKNRLTDDELAYIIVETFGACGTIETVKVLRDAKLCPYAFVQYENEQDALKAIRQFNGMPLYGRPMRCERASVNRTLYIGPRSKATKWWATEFVSNLCSKYGPLESIVPNVNESSRWFVRFVYREDAVRAYATLVSEGKCSVDWVQNLPDEAYLVDFDKMSSVLVSPLPQDASEEDLMSRFSRYGEIESVKFVPSRNNDTCAIVEYSNSTEAVVAIECACHTTFLGRTVRVRLLDPAKVIVPHFATPPVQLAKKCKPISDGPSFLSAKDSSRFRYQAPMRNNRGNFSGSQHLHQGFESRKLDSRKSVGGGFFKERSQVTRFETRQADS